VKIQETRPDPLRSDKIKVVKIEPLIEKIIAKEK
jgi:hypothetical protein